MAKKIEIYCENSNTNHSYFTGKSLKEIADDLKIKLKHFILGARVNNEIEELTYEIFRPKRIKFFDITDTDGMRMYVRSLWFVLQKAVKETFPGLQLKIQHSISKGYYCEIETPDNKEVTLQMVSDIENRMRQIIAADYPFERREMLTKEAVEVFKTNGLHEKALLFDNYPELYTSVYYLDNTVDYFYGYLVPSSGYLQVFDLVKYYDGMLLRIPQQKEPEKLEDIVQQNQLFKIFQEHKTWTEILEIPFIGRINQVVMNGRGSELIKVGEALHEKKVAGIADTIYHQKPDKRLILISGPSSSGKTTFSKRLAIQLKVAGLKPIQLSLDNFFVDREKTPLDEKGEYDFESLYALDIQLFNQVLKDLMQEKEVRLPKFSFSSGKRFYTDETLVMQPDNILLVEGIHALNPQLTPIISDELKFKIYVSALTQLSIDHHNRIPTTDNRLIRRIIRDYQYRNYSALETLQRWNSVRRGEEKNIFPYQEEANIMFNSALFFELGILRPYAEPLLKEVQQLEPEYSEVMRLLKFLSYFKSIPADEIPPTSILREFLGGSSFYY